MKNFKFLLIGVISICLFLYPVKAFGQTTPEGSPQAFKLETKKINKNQILFYVTVESDGQKATFIACADVTIGVLGLIRKNSETDVVAFVKAKAYSTGYEVFNSQVLPLKGTQSEDILLAKFTAKGYQFSKITNDQAVRQAFAVFDQLLNRMSSVNGKNETALTYSMEEAIKILTFECPREWKWTLENEHNDLLGRNIV